MITSKKENNIIVDKRILEMIITDQQEELEAKRNEILCHREWL